MPVAEMAECAERAAPQRFAVRKHLTVRGVANELIGSKAVHMKV
jgi:hypothetical protein